MDVVGAIADPIRRDILAMLRDGPRSAGAIAAEFDVSRPAISRHLRVLRDHELVVDEAKGRERRYRLDVAPLAELDQWLAQFRPRWAHALDALETEVRRTGRDRRATAERATSQGAMSQRASPRSTEQRSHTA